MKVVVIGATGGTGRAVVEELLEGGHEVTAFSRHADRLGLPSERLTLLAGDALDSAQTERAVSGQDAVVVSLGVNDNPLKVRFLKRSKTPVDICSRGTRVAIDAMKRQGVRKLVVVSAYGVGPTRDKLPRPWRLIYRLLLKEQIADKELQEQLVRESGLDWVIVQPVGLTDRPAQPAVHVSEAGEMRRSTVPRRNVGKLVAAAATNDLYLRRTVAISL